MLPVLGAFEIIVGILRGMVGLSDLGSVMLPVLGAFEIIVEIPRGMVGSSDSGSVMLPVLGAFKIVVGIPRETVGSSDSGSVMLPVLRGALPDPFFGVVKLVKYNEKISETARTGSYIQVSNPIGSSTRCLLRRTKNATVDKA